jgi:DNA-binding MltR family transcriptional regulator
MPLPPNREVSSQDDQDVLEEMSEVYFEATVDQLIDAVSKITYDSGKALAFFKSCDKESDRATPVLIFSFIENAIRELFAKELCPETPGGVKSLFEPFGPLSTTSARIKMLAALEWISPRTANNMDLIRKIRNNFAHDPPEDGFLNEKIKSLIESMYPYEAPLLEPTLLKRLKLPLIDSNQLVGRVLFVTRAALTFSNLVQELMTHPKALRMGLPAGAALARGHERLPKNLKDAQEFGIRVLLHIMFPNRHTMSPN